MRDPPQFVSRLELIRRVGLAVLQAGVPVDVLAEPVNERKAGVPKGTPAALLSMDFAERLWFEVEVPLNR